MTGWVNGGLMNGGLMNRGLIAAELTLIRRDRAFLIACVFMLFLGAYATVSGLQWQHDRHVSHNHSVETSLATVESELAQLIALKTGELPLEASPSAGLPHLARTEFYLPPTPISGLAIGDSELRPSYAAISATVRAHEIFRFQEVDNPIILGLGRFDFAFVVIYLLPLLILGFGCMTLSADRENRSLQMVLSHPVTPTRLAALRIALRTGLAVMCVIGGLALGLAGHGENPGDALPALTGYVLTLMAYAVFWMSIALWIVALNRNSETNAVLMVTSWLLWVLVVPALATFATKEIHPVPSRLEYIVAARDAENAANARSRDLLQRYLLDHPELEATQDSAVAPFIKTFYLVQREVEQSLAPIVQSFAAAEAAQQELRMALRWLSPRDVAAESLLLSSGNDSLRFTEFERQARQLREEWLSAVETALISGRRLSAAEFTDLPRSRFNETPASKTVTRQAVSVLALLFFASLITLAALRRLRRYSPV